MCVVPLPFPYNLIVNIETFDSNSTVVLCIRDVWLIFLYLNAPLGTVALLVEGVLDGGGEGQ